jgi:hypothetical protein
VHPGCDSVIFASVQDSGDRVDHQVRCGAGHGWAAHEWLLLAHQLRRPQPPAWPPTVGQVASGAGSVP